MKSRDAWQAGDELEAGRRQAGGSQELGRRWAGGRPGDSPNRGTAGGADIQASQGEMTD